MQIRASERARAMARRRWALDRARRDALAAAEPLHLHPELRLVIIAHEREVHEEIIPAGASGREHNRAWRRARQWAQAAFPK
jgi:hypothetical protein